MENEEEYSITEAIKNNQDCLSDGLTCNSCSDTDNAESDYEEEGLEEGEEFPVARNIFEILDDEEGL